MLIIVAAAAPLLRLLLQPTLEMSVLESSFFSRRRKSLHKESLKVTKGTSNVRSAEKGIS